MSALTALLIACSSWNSCWISTCRACASLTAPATAVFFALRLPLAAISRYPPVATRATSLDGPSNVCGCLHMYVTSRSRDPEQISPDFPKTAVAEMAAMPSSKRPQHLDRHPRDHMNAAPLSHPSIVDGWFTEVNAQSFPGQGFSLRVRKILHVAKSQFQDILVFESTDYGNVLVLDGIVQCTERDEFAYQEMISHVPLYLHERPKRVLVIGGGDGGVLREVLRHHVVDTATLVEIDATVIELARKYLPGMAVALDPHFDSRVDIKLCDGFQFLRDLPQSSSCDKYDVIITDSSDPEGPAEAFFQREYFQLLANALADDNGIIIAQTSENCWLNVDYLKQLSQVASSVFENVKYCYTMVPSYTSGQLGLLVCSKNKNLDLTVPRRTPTEQEQNKLKYYNKSIHSASFVLPKWADSILNGTD